MRAGGIPEGIRIPLQTGKVLCKSSRPGLCKVLRSPPQDVGKSCARCSRAKKLSGRCLFVDFLMKKVCGLRPHPTRGAAASPPPPLWVPFSSESRQKDICQTTSWPGNILHRTFRHLAEDFSKPCKVRARRTCRGLLFFLEIPVCRGIQDYKVSPGSFASSSTCVC